MSVIALLQQQQARRQSDAFAIWSAEQIASILGAPVENVRSQWPLVYAALQEFGIADEPTLTAALATIGVETGTFLPVREGWWLDRDYGHEWAEAYRRHEFRYYPYYGRGLIQLTWLSNYERAEEELGIVGLYDNPDLALRQDHSALIFAWYFATHGGSPLIPQAARQGRWIEVRRLVNGGSNGLGDFLKFVEDLQAARQR